MGKSVWRVTALLVFGVASAPAQISVQGSPIYRQESRPGETYVGTIVVKNTSGEPQEAKLYPTDYTTNANGTTVYGEPGSGARSNARWVSLSSTRAVVPPNQTMNISFTVTVPAGQALSGSYWSMVMLEAVPRGTAESGLPGPAKQGQLGLITKIRYAVQIVTDIRAGATREARFEAPVNMLAKDSTRALQLDLKNTGTLAFVPNLKLELYAEDGTHVKTITAVREIIYPTTSIRHQFVFGRLPIGSYRAVVTVDTGDDAVFGAQYVLKM